MKSSRVVLRGFRRGELQLRVLDFRFKMPLYLLHAVTVVPTFLSKVDLLFESIKISTLLNVTIVMQDILTMDRTTGSRTHEIMSASELQVRLCLFIGNQN